MARVFLKRRERFAAAHRLHSEQLNAAENVQVYGKCNNTLGHGHNYELIVTVAGEINAETGMILSIEELKEMIRTAVINKVDHKHLNHDVDFLCGINPTAENLVVAFWRELHALVPKGLLYEVTLIETENNQASYFGP